MACFNLPEGIARPFFIGADLVPALRDCIYTTQPISNDSTSAFIRY